MIIFSFDYSGVTQLEIPTELESFLGDESIEKCGVQIKGDVTRVRKQYNVVTRGVVELKELARKLSSVPNKAKDTVSFRLAELVKRFLHCTLPKPNDLRMGDWERSPLTKPQVNYAALDAYASARLLEVLRAPVVSVSNPTVASAAAEVSSSSSAAAASSAAAERMVEAPPEMHAAAVAAQAQPQSSNELQAQLLRVAVTLTLEYATSTQRSSFELPPGLSRSSRATLHALAEKNGLSHTSTGSGDDNFNRRLVLSRRRSSASSSSSATAAGMDIDAASSDDLAEMAAAIGLPKTWREEIDPNWGTCILDYDTFHWEGNLLLMAHGKQTQLFRYFAHGVGRIACVPYVDPDTKKTDRELWTAALLREGKTAEEIKRLGKSYWRGKERTVRPSPLQLLTDYIRFIFFFSRLRDHEVGRLFFHAQWKKQACKSLSYIARGWLSDPLGMPMYLAVPNSGRMGLSLYRCLRGSSALEAWHLLIRLLFPANGLTMLATNHDTVMNQFIFRTNLLARRRFCIDGREMNACAHFNTRLLDMMADSAERCDYYPEGKRPFKEHVSVDMNQPITLLSGMAAEARAIAEKSGLHAASSSPVINESGVAALARMLGAPPDQEKWRTELSPAEVSEMATLPDLWRNPQSMMDWALERGVFKCELQWRDFIDKQLKDATTWKLLRNSGYLELMRK